MATLEDKLLGEKTHCYCSSSSSEHEDDSEDEVDSKKGETEMCKRNSEPYKWEGISTNTGPKGVIKDWQRFKQLETEKRDDQDRERSELMKKLSLTCDSKPEDDPEMADLLVDDAFLLQYQKQRMEEMLSKKGLPTFGKLYDLKSNGDFLDAIDKEHRGVTIIIHIYESNLTSCKCMNKCLNSIAPNYPHVKFCKFIGSSAGMSHRYIFIKNRSN